MENSDAMTIEFLRARLLSERSVSRSARQRADELAKRVKELEEQLKLVTLQRKKAEKAMEDVLTILENQGVTDFSEEFDLGSDEEMPSESGVGNDSSKGEERSMSSKGRQHDSNDLSGSEPDSSPVAGRSLSWKGRINSSHSSDKYKNYNGRRRSNFSSAGFAKHRGGRSCRQIKCRETRSVVEESRDEPVKVNGLKNEVSHSSEGGPNCSDTGSDIPRTGSIIQEKGKSEMKRDNNNYNVDAYGGERDMERALEQQAELIGRYEAMEKAQREWEEKFRENNNGTPDSCDPGNYSDITEEREESKAQTPSSTRVVITEEAQESKPEGAVPSIPEEIFKAKTRDNLPKSSHDTGSHENQNTATTVSNSGLIAQDNSDSTLMENKNQKSSDIYHHQPSDRRHQGAHSFGPNDSKPIISFSTDAYDDGLTQKDTSSSSKNKHDLYALVPHKPLELTGVLDSLRQAKLSLQQELNRLPLVDNAYTGKAINTFASSSSSKAEERLDIPIGCSGLFRLPTDFPGQAPPRSTAFDPPSHLSSNFYDRDNQEILRTPVNQLGTATYFGSIGSSSSPYFGGGSRSLGFYPENHQALTTHHSLDSGLRFETKKPPFDPYMDAAGLVASSSSNSGYPTYPVYPSYQNLTPQRPFNDGHSRPYPSGSVGNRAVPPADPFAFYDDHARQNMYR